MDLELLLKLLMMVNIKTAKKLVNGIFIGGIKKKINKCKKYY